MKITRNGHSEDRVLYGVSNPMTKAKEDRVVGAATASVEAVVDLVATPQRKPNRVSRPPHEINDVTFVYGRLLLRCEFGNINNSTSA